MAHQFKDKCRCCFFAVPFPVINFPHITYYTKGKDFFFFEGIPLSLFKSISSGLAEAGIRCVWRGWWCRETGEGGEVGERVRTERLEWRVKEVGGEEAGGGLVLAEEEGGVGVGLGRWS